MGVMFVVEPLGLRVVELEALLELREQDARRLAQAISVFPDPRTRQQGEECLETISKEIESIRRELGELTGRQKAQLGPGVWGFAEKGRRDEVPAQA
jgi:hypothetical protein